MTNAATLLFDKRGKKNTRRHALLVSLPIAESSGRIKVAASQPPSQQQEGTLHSPKEVSMLTVSSGQDKSK